MKATFALPKITVVTPSYNQGQYIEETIQSVLDQKYPNLEYIVMDGGSTDETVDILRKYEKHLTWFSEKDRGQSEALNKGFRMGTGEIFAFINSDDVYEPGAFHKVGTFFARHPQAYWMTGKCRVIDHQGREIRRLVTAYKNFWLLFKSYQVLQVLDYISQPATFWRREAIEKVGPFDEKLHYSLDYDFSLRVGKDFKLWVLKDYLAAFRIHPSAKSRLIHDYFNEDLSIAQKYTRSNFLVGLHRLHNQLIIFAYTKMNKEANSNSL